MLFGSLLGLLWLASASPPCLPCIDRTQVNIVAVVHGTPVQSFWLQVQRAARTAAANMKVNLKFDLQPVYSSASMANAVRAAAATQPHALLVSLPSDEVADAVAHVTRNMSIPVFSLNVGYERASAAGTKAHVSMDDLAAGGLVFPEFVAALQAKGANLTTCLSVGTDVLSFAQAQRARGFTARCNALGAKVLAPVFVNGESVAAMETVLYTQFSVMAAAGQLHGLAVLSLEDRAAPSVVSQLKRVQGGALGTAAVGSFEVSALVYTALASGDIIFGVDQGAWLQGYLPVVLATLYATTGKLLALQLYPTGPKLVRRAPALVDQACNQNAFPLYSCPWAFGNESSVPTSQCAAPPPLAETSVPCPSQDARKVRLVGVTHGVVSDSYWHVVRGGAVQAALDFRLENFKFDLVQQYDPAEQARRILQVAVDPQVDGIFVSLPGTYGDAISNATAAAARTKFVVTVSVGGADYAYRLDSPDGNLIAHTGIESYAATFAAGEIFLVRFGTKRIFCVMTIYLNAAQRQACQGLKDYAESQGGYVVGVDMGKDIDTSNSDLVTKYLTDKITQYPEVEGLVLLSVRLVPNALAAMSATRWLITAVNSPNVDVYNAMKAGKIHFYLDQVQYLQGYMSVLLLVIRKLTGQSLVLQASKVLSPTSAVQFGAPDVIAAQCEAQGWIASVTGTANAAAFTKGFPTCPFDPSCRPGSVKTAGGDCETCPPGRASAGGMQVTCTECAAGTVADAPSAAATCVQCAPGSYTSDALKTSCELCGLGHFVGGSGATACATCTLGEYASSLGATACTQCGAGKLRPWLYATLQLVDGEGAKVWVPFLGASSAAQCGCSAGAYDDAGECTPCGVGLVCPGMGDVLLEPGYFSTQSSPTSVFRCFGSSWPRCPGGLPGSCAAGRLNTSVACTSCQADMFSTDAGPCKPCGKDGALPFAIVAVVLLLILVGVYWLIDASGGMARNRQVLAVGLVASQIVTFLQQLGVFGTIAVQWPRPFKDVLVFLELFAFSPDILRVDCLQTTGPVAKFSGRVFLGVVLVVAVILIHVLYVLVVHRGAFRARNIVLFRAVGTLLSVFFISVVSTALVPFHCFRHPNGVLTVRNYPGVVCYDRRYGSDHASMLTIAGAALTIPIAFLCMVLYAIRRFPAAVGAGDVRFFHKFSFLFFRFRPDAYWYVLFSLLRNASIVIVVTFGYPTLQVAMLESILVLSALTIARFSPWAVHLGSQLEAGTTTFLCAIIHLFSFLVTDADIYALANWCCALAAFPVVVMLCVACYGLYARFAHKGKAFQFFLCHHKSAAGNFVRLLKMFLVSRVGKRRQVFLDSDALFDLDELFSIVGSSVENLVVVCTSQILTRPWCMGEVATAMLRQVTTVKVPMKDFAWPEPDFIARYAEYVPEAAMLAKDSISIGMLQDALRWLEGRPSIAWLDKEVTQTSVSDLVEGLLSGRNYAGPQQQPELGHVRPDASDCMNVIVADTTCCEAVCAAIVLQKMLAPYFFKGSPPCVLPEGGELPDSTQLVCVLCTNGAFSSWPVVKNLLRAAEMAVGMLPIVAEAAFRFPTAEFYDRLRFEGGRVADLAEVNSSRFTAILVWVVEQLFREIAVEWNPQEGEGLLKARAQSIAGRIGRGVKSRGRPPADLPPDSPAEGKSNADAGPADLPPDSSAAGTSNADAGLPGVPNWEAPRMGPDIAML